MTSEADRRAIAARKHMRAEAQENAIRRERGRIPRVTLRQIEVDNPYFQPEHKESPSNPKRSDAVVNIRESAIETMFARGVIDQAQKKAADKFRAFWEAMGGKESSMDYTQDRVDGGRGDPVVGRLTAAQELNKARLLLGARLYDLVCKVCGEGRALSEVSESKRDKLTAADNLRNSLDDLAEMWGLKTRGKLRRAG